MKNLKGMGLGCFIIITLFSCTQNSENIEKEKHRIIQNNNISDVFIQQCTYLGFTDYLIGSMFEIESNMYTIPESYILSDSIIQNKDETLQGICEMIGEDYLLDLVEQILLPEYLHLNIHIPHFDESINYYTTGATVYILNALSREGLQVITNGYNNILEQPIYEYEAIEVTPGYNSCSALRIDEDFSRTHIVMALTYRDEITDWNHLCKGSQPTSDLAIVNSVTYQGFGCETSSDLLSIIPNVIGEVVIPIKHSKNTLKKPCDEHYDHFCEFGKPQVIEAENQDLFTTLDFDPDITSWSKLDFSSNVQYIPIANNIDGLNLVGHDFLISPIVINCDSFSVYIPQQISKYDSIHNAQSFTILYY